MPLLGLEVAEENEYGEGACTRERKDWSRAAPRVEDID